MEIKNTLLNSLDPYRNRVEQRSGNAPDRSAADAAPATAQGDRVSLSANARLHGAVHAEAMAAPDVRREKVDALKERVADGTYAIDSRQVALKLLQSDALLAGTLED